MKRSYQRDIMRQTLFSKPSQGNLTKGLMKQTVLRKPYEGNFIKEALLRRPKESLLEALSRRPHEGLHSRMFVDSLPMSWNVSGGKFVVEC